MKSFILLLLNAYNKTSNVCEYLNIVIFAYYLWLEYFTLAVSFLITFDSNLILKNLQLMSVILSFLWNKVSVWDSILFNCYLFLLFDIEILYLFLLLCLFFLITILFCYLIIFFFILFLGLFYEISRGILNFKESFAN